MNREHVEEIKKEDKKAFKSYVVALVIGGFIGGIFVASSEYLREILGESVPNLLISILETITPFASIVLSILVIIISTIVYNKSRKEYDLWSEANEDDDVIDKIEERLSYILLLTYVNFILGFFFFGVGLMVLNLDEISISFAIIKFICFLGGFILCVVSSTLIQKKIVNLEKEINPLLKGSVYDAKFSKKWLDSCDEAIKLGIFKSAYKAYTSVSTTCVILWVICVLGYDIWDFGIVPIAIVTIIWLVLTISYCIESIKQSKVK
ncbi:DUF3169 family protein [Terrisporobacter sp.]|uniref:DUF3169 family protein n=1 Tax=Terrisporobacter sp. TaxID=1965305 RepID=UPI0026051984|nr:DUF3169 family protein [Terrisporobacter sp.]